MCLHYINRGEECLDNVRDNKSNHCIDSGFYYFGVKCLINRMYT
jgi:hypothetical protein